MKYFIIALLIIFGTSCQQTPSKSYNQGIQGKVLWLEGNFMPGPGQDKKGEPIARLLYIFDPLKASDIPHDGNFYKPQQEPIKIISSDTDGNFHASLPVGTYTLLSKEEEGLYANLMDGEGYINPVKVEEGKFTDITFKIDYKAVY